MTETCLANLLKRSWLLLTPVSPVTPSDRRWCCCEFGRQNGQTHLKPNTIQSASPWTGLSGKQAQGDSISYYVEWILYSFAVNGEKLWWLGQLNSDLWIHKSYKQAHLWLWKIDYKVTLFLHMIPDPHPLTVHRHSHFFQRGREMHHCVQ